MDPYVVNLLIASLVIVVALTIGLRMALKDTRPRGTIQVERLVDNIMELSEKDRERLEYAVEKVLEHAERGPTIDELMALFDKLPDDQQAAELAELRRRVAERKGKGRQ